MRRNPFLGKGSAALAAAAGVLLFLPFAGLDRYLLDVMTTGFLLSVFTGSWDVAGGVAGQISLGHALFFGTATYACAILTTLLGWPFPVAAAAAVLLSSAAGTAVGLLCAPLKGPFVAVLTLALGEAAHEAALLGHFTSGGARYTWGGEGGLPVTLPWEAASPLESYYAALLFLFVAVSAMLLLRRSREGLILRAVDGSELTARASGVDAAKHKRRAFAISAGLAGAAGAAYAAHLGRAAAADFSVELSFQAAALATLGGRGTVIGPVAATLLLHALFQGLAIPPGVRILCYALTLLLFLRFFPGGFAGAAEAFRERRGWPSARKRRTDGARGAGP
jgi:branched-chain amino acid transport system permease protein